MFSAPGPDASYQLMTAAQHLEPVDVEMARQTYLEAWGAALFAGRLSRQNTLLDVSRAARSAPRSPGSPGSSDLLLDSLSMLILDGRARGSRPARRGDPRLCRGGHPSS